MALGPDAAFSTRGGEVTLPRCVPGLRAQPGRRPCPPCWPPDAAQIALRTAQGPGVLSFNDGVARPEPAQQSRTPPFPLRLFSGELGDMFCRPYS